MLSSVSLSVIAPRVAPPSRSVAVLQPSRPPIQRTPISRWRTILTTLIAMLTATWVSACGGGGGGDGATQPPGPQPAITLTIPAPNAAVVVGSSTAVALVITRSGGFTGAVTLAVSGAPTGVAAVFIPSTIDATTTSAILTLTAGGTAAAGASTLTVTATGSGVSSQSAVVQLTVTAPVVQSSFTLTAAPAALSVAAGQTGSTAIAIARSAGFTGAVTLSLDGPPAGIVGTFTSSPTTAASASLAISVASTVAAGNYTLTARGAASGAADRVITITLTVTTALPVGFSIAVDPVEFEVPAGGGWSANGIVSIVRNSGFTGAVNVSVSTLAGSALTIVGVSPAVIAAGATGANLIAIAGDGVAPGVYAGTVKVSATGFADQTAPVRVRVSAPSTGTIVWQYCNASRVPRFFAVRDGATGAWRHVVPAGSATPSATSPTTFSFSLTQSTGAVATVNLGEKTSSSTLIEGHDWKVFYMTAQEITEQGAQECIRYPYVTTRAATGTITGYTSFDAVLPSAGKYAIAGVGSTGPLTTSLSFSNLQPGPFDFLVTRSSFNSVNAPIVVQSIVLQRGLDPANGAAIPAVSFATAGVAPAIASVTFGNFGTEPFTTAQSLLTANGLNGLMSAVAGYAIAARPWYGVPADRLIAGDVHQIVASTTTTSARRSIIAYSRAVSARSLDFGSPLTAPTVTAGAAGASPWIVRATGTLSGDYTGRASMYLRETFADPRTMTMVATRGGLGAGSTYDVAVPDLSTATGFTFFWNFRRGNAVAWTVTGGEGDPGGPDETFCILSGICPVKAVDGAVYKSAQQKGTVNVP